MATDHSSYPASKSADDLLSTDWEEIIKDLHNKGPISYSLLAAMSSRHGSTVAMPTEEDRVVIAMVHSMLTYNCNNRVNRVQLAVGLLVDHGGATKEVNKINIF